MIQLLNKKTNQWYGLTAKAIAEKFQKSDYDKTEWRETQPFNTRVSLFIASEKKGLNSNIDITTETHALSAIEKQYNLLENKDERS